VTTQRGCTQGGRGKQWFAQLVSECLAAAFWRNRDRNSWCRGCCRPSAGIDRPKPVVDGGSGTGLSARSWAAQAGEVGGVEPNKANPGGDVALVDSARSGGRYVRDRLGLSSLQATESEAVMALGIFFAPQSLSAEQYDDVMRQLEAAGQGAPAGRLYHSAFSSGGGLHIFDVWDSQASFDAFGQTLMPILAEAGIDPGRPQVSEVHNIVQG